MIRRLEAPRERWQHGASAETGVDGVQRVASPVEIMRRERWISDADVVSADRFFNDHSRGIDGVAEGPGDFRLDAAVNFRAAERGVGTRNAQILNFLVLHRFSIDKLASAYEVSRLFMLDEAKDALRALSDHYARADGPRAARRPTKKT